MLLKHVPSHKEIWLWVLTPTDQHKQRWPEKNRNLRLRTHNKSLLPRSSLVDKALSV